MDAELKAIRRALLEQQAELQQLVEQMQSDHLIQSPVYKNLESELTTIRQKLKKQEFPDK